jgi:AraC family transcriptional regulator
MTASKRASSMLITEAHAKGGAMTARELQRQVLTYFSQDTSLWHSSHSSPRQRIDIPKGAVVVSMRNQWEKVEWITDATMLSVHLDDTVLSNTSEVLLGKPNAELVPSPGISDPRLSALFETLRIENELGYPTGRLFIDSVEQAVSSYLIQSHSGNVSNFYKGGMSPTVARRMVEYIENNLAEDLSIADLAEIAEMSPSHFSRNFRSSFRVTPHEFIVRMRVEFSKELLRDNSHTILDAAQLSGFKTQQHFSRVFAKAVGVSPGRFKRMN